MLEPITSSPAIRKQLDMTEFPRNGDGSHVATVPAAPPALPADKLTLSRKPSVVATAPKPAVNTKKSVFKLIGGLALAAVGLGGAAALVTGIWATAPFWAGWAALGVIGTGTWIAAKGAAELGKKWRARREQNRTEHHTRSESKAVEAAKAAAKAAAAAAAGAKAGAQPAY